MQKFTDPKKQAARSGVNRRIPGDLTDGGCFFMAKLGSGSVIHYPDRVIIEGQGFPEGRYIIKNVIPSVVFDRIGYER